MKKRTFLKNLGFGTGAALLLPSILTSCENSSDEDFKLWTWTGGNKEIEQWDAEFKRLANAGFHGVLCGGGESVLEKTIPIAKKYGLEIHAWMWVMNQPGNKETQAHPEWYAVSREGNSSLDTRPYVDYYQWLCPNKPEVQNYLFDRMMKVVDLKDLDGLQLDYIRFCDVILPKGLWSKYDLIQDHEMPEFDFCYCETCRSKFEKQYGFDPLEIEDPSSSEEWKQFRYDSITNVVNMLAKGVHQRDKKISASVFATPQRARKLVRQAWDQWDLDFVFPMIYYKFYDEPVDFVKTGTAEGIEALNDRIPLYTAQYLHDKSNEEVKDFIKAAKAGGAQGLALYDYGLMNDEFLEIIQMHQNL